MWSFRGEGGFYGRVSTVNVGKFIASWADQVRRLPETTRAQGTIIYAASDDLGRARYERLAQIGCRCGSSGCTAVYCAVCHGLYSTTERIGAISALARGSLHATAVAKTAQSSKTRVMGRPGEAQALPCGCCPSVPGALFCRRRQSESYHRMHAGHYYHVNHACTYIYTVHTQFSHRTAAGHARRVQRVDLLRTMEHLCMTAHKHTHAPTDTHTHKSVKHVVLQTAPATWDRAAPCSLYKKHGSKRVCTIVCCTSLFLCNAALVQKGTWKNHRGCEAEGQRNLTRWEALTVLVVAFRPSVPARQHAFCQPGRPCSCGEER